MEHQNAPGILVSGYNVLCVMSTGVPALCWLGLAVWSPGNIHTPEGFAAHAVISTIMTTLLKKKNEDAA